MTSSVRIYALLARSAERAVVFRRGPTKQVLLLAWNTANDEFEPGQWLKGRIYERRCDLSPDGRLLLYFAANHKQPYSSWSAISQPPYLTALALWPKGDAWGGGGHFVGDTEIALNHRPNEMDLAAGFRLPRNFHVRPFGSQSGWGEDNPVWAARLERDGWRLAAPLVWEKPHPFASRRYTLRMEILGIHEKNAPWYSIEHAVVSNDRVSHALGPADWAEWSASGDLLYAKDGALYRLHCERGVLAPLDESRRLIDLGGLAFTPVEAPLAAQFWPRRRTRK